MSDPATGTAIGDLLDPRAIRLHASAADRDEAVRACGRALVDIGAVEESYVQTMLDRERSISTYIGEAVAIPHGTTAGKEAVLRDALAVVRFPGGVDWGGPIVKVAVGIAARGDGHLAILTQLADVLLDPDQAYALRTATDPRQVIDLLRPAGERPGAETYDQGPTGPAPTTGPRPTDTHPADTHPAHLPSAEQESRS
jgi:PTS system mannitol-specific IIA component